MDSGRPSATAIGAALLRAAHLVLDGEPKIVTDAVGMTLSGVQEGPALQTALEAMEAEAARVVGVAAAPIVLRAVRTAALVRSRYSEDALVDALPRGITQYVILGAGLDSFAYRRHDLAGQVHVFEVDHPATQDWKRVRLQTLQMAVPPHLRFIPLDFEHQALLDALQAGGYRPEEPALFSWLGVTQYLSAEAVDATLRQVATAAPRSELVVGYLVPETLLDAENRHIFAFLQAVTAARGEPILSVFTPAQLATQLHTLGFPAVQDCGAENVLARYTAGRSDRLQHPQTHRLMHARVGGGMKEDRG